MAAPKKRGGNRQGNSGKHSGNRSGGGKGGAKKVEIFTASFCPHCRDAKAYLKARKIPFTEYNLEHSASAEKKFRGYGGKAIPLLIVKGKILRRWDTAAFEKLFGEG
jgi:glutaredoxin